MGLPIVRTTSCLKPGPAGFVVGSVHEVADEGFEACMNGDVIRVPGALNLAAILAGRAAPKWLLRRLTGAVVRGMRR